jgi:hypothetical protein
MLVFGLQNIQMPRIDVVRVLKDMHGDILLLCVM